MKFVIWMAALWLATAPIAAEARVLAWVLDQEGWAHKIDVAGGKVLEKKTLPGNPSISTSLEDPDNAVVYDTAANLLLLVNDYGRDGQWIGGYTLSTLAFIKKLDLRSSDPDAALPKILVMPGGGSFFVFWWGANAQTVTAFDKATLASLPEAVTPALDPAATVRYSTSGNLIYAIKLAENLIEIYDASSLQQADSVSIEGIWSAGVVERHMDDYCSGKILFRESVETGTGTSYRYFTYDVALKTVSKKITVKEDGYGIIAQDGKKLFVIENGVSRIGVYDTVNGYKLKTVDLTGSYSDLRAMHQSSVSPDNTRFFVQGEALSTGTTTVIALDMGTLTVSAELQGVTGGSMIFFNE